MSDLDNRIKQEKEQEYRTMKSNDLKEQIEAAERVQSGIPLARDVLEKRIKFLTLQAESLEYPAQQGDKQAQNQRAALLMELSNLNKAVESNEQEACALSENIAALNGQYQAARLE